jgi:ADP-heptose:LPS heptosyltransferase
MGPDSFGGSTVRERLRERGWTGGPYVVFGAFPNQRNPERRWYPRYEPWVRLAALARAAGITPVLAGGQEHIEGLEQIARENGALCLAGQTSLPELMALCAGAEGTIAVDTGIAHLAAATGRPTVVIFSHGQEFWDFPCGPKVISLRGNPAFEPLYPVSPRFPDDVVRPWTAATSSIPAERAWSVLNALAAEP